MIDKPGVYDIDDATYHADPCIEPSLSSSIARVLLKESPRHAYVQHPRLNPYFKATHKTTFDIGTAAHALMLGTESDVVQIDAADWRKKETQRLRDTAYNAGQIPILVRQYGALTAMVRDGREQIAEHEDASILEPMDETEKVLVWREGDVWCRAKLDVLNRSRSCIWDYKTTGKSAHPDVWRRGAFDIGYDVQEAFYRRGYRAVFGEELQHFRFLVQETRKPYSLATPAIGPASVAMAARKVDVAIRIWGECMRSGYWPGYPSRTCWVEAPSYHETEWLEREARDEEEAHR